MSPLNMLTV